jgi:hypothetical protein
MEQTMTEKQLIYYKTKLIKNEERLIQFSNDYDETMKKKRCCNCRRGRRALCENYSLHWRFRAFMTAYEKESKENDRIVLQIQKLEKMLK